MHALLLALSFAASPPPPLIERIAVPGSSAVFTLTRAPAEVLDSGATEAAYLLRFTEDGTDQALTPAIDLIDAVRKTSGAALQGHGRIAELNVQFVDRQVGFLYGFELGYGYFPFLFRTADGGRSWTSSAPHKKGDPGWSYPFRRSDFFMFDGSRGIALTGGNDDTGLRYFITTDSGVSWTKKEFKLSRPALRQWSHSRPDHLIPRSTEPSRKPTACIWKESP